MLSESKLDVLSSIRVINGFVSVKSNSLKNLRFLRNLEIINHNRSMSVLISNSK